MDIQPKYLYNDKGIMEYVMLSYEDYQRMLEKMEDLEDLEALRKAREENKNKKTYSHNEVLKALKEDKLDTLIE